MPASAHRLLCAVERSCPNGPPSSWRWPAGCLRPRRRWHRWKGD